MTARRAVAAAGVLFLLAVFTGGAASPVTPLLILPVALLLRHVPQRAIVFTPVAAALALFGLSAALRGVDRYALFGAIALMTGSYAGLLWRSEARRTAPRLAQLDDILVRASLAGSGEALAAAQLQDLQRTLALMADRLGAHAATLWSVSDTGDMAVPVAWTGTRRPARVRLAGDPLGWAWHEGVRLKLETAPAWAEPGLATVVERLRRERESGDLISWSFARDDVAAQNALEEAAIMLRGILSLHEQRAAAANMTERVRTLTRELRRIPEVKQVDAFARDLCATAMSVADATGAAVAIWSEGTGEVLAVTGDDGGPLPGSLFVPPDSELALAIRADAPLIRTADHWTLQRTTIANAEERWHARPKCLAALPLRNASEIVGVLAVWSSRARQLDPEAVELLGLLTPYAALHLEQAQAFGRLRDTAERDPLTRLRNRRAFEDFFDTETARFERYARSLALLLLDVDHFKSINDRFGHEAGDEVLRRVARLVEASVRDTDVAARFGGEEFVVLLPETSLASALEVAERIRAGVAALEIDWRGTQIPVRISIGVAAAPERVPHPRELIGTADAALYRAKAAGRDQVC